MRIQQSNMRDIDSVTEWSARSQETSIDDSRHGAAFFSNRIADFHAQRLEWMLRQSSPMPSMAGSTPPLSRQDSEVFVVFEKPGFFALLKAKLAKLFCLARPN